MAALPPSPSSLNEKGTAVGVEFKTYQTSAAIIERTGWKIQQPILWTTQSEAGAVDFIKQPSQRDRRKLLSNNRFRILLVKYQETADKAPSTQNQGSQESLLYGQKSVIDAARESGWIGERFDSFIRNNTAGSAILEAPGSINFIAQAPKDDGFPFFALSLAHRSTETHQRDADWECLLFVRPASLWDDSDDSAEALLCRDPFPHDYPEPLSPDFMVLPVVLLRWQVEQIMKELNAMKTLMEQDQDLITRPVEEFKKIRDTFFVLRQKNLLLHRRWEFASELAGNLMEAFGVIERRYSSEDEVVKYSPTLTASVANQQAILKSVIHDLDTTGSRIESQQKLVDDQTKAAIDQRDSVSLNIIAVLTLIFLPATFVATIFGMSIFNWQAGQTGDNTIVSHWIWLYFVLSAALTLIVLLAWKAVSKYEERRVRKKWAEKLA